jgi:uncharacterized protein YkwD
MKTKLLSLLLVLVILTLSISQVFAADYNEENTIIINGDVNNNSVVDIEDARIALRIATGIIESNNEQADINRDGVVTIDDARTILRIAARIQENKPKTYTEWKITVPSTCNKQGEAVSYCVTDNTTKIKKLPFSEHINIIAATCTEGAYCGDCFKFTSDALGHSISNNVCTRCKEDFSKVPYVVLNNQKINFSSSLSELESILGIPTEVLTSETLTEKIFYAIYCNDYDKLTIITLTELDGVVSLYTLDTNAVFYVNNEKINVNSYNDINAISVNEFKVNFFVDKLGTNEVYAMLFTKKNTFANNFDTNGTISTYEKLIYHNANSCRVLNGLTPLEFSEKISSVSRNHSRDMAERNYFSHHSPEGTTPGERLTTSEIKWLACGENICAGYNLIFDFNNAWYNSEGHRKIMLTPSYNYIGVGIYYKSDSEYRYYATQNYIKSN